jgi:hypothetical protein
MITKLYYRQCENCKGGMSDGYDYHHGEYFFCSDKCVGKYFGDKKSFTTLKDWNDNGPGLTWKEFQDSWDDIDDNEYAYDWQLDICSYTDWSRGHEDVDVYDRDGKAYNFDDVCDDSRYEFQEG